MAFRNANVFLTLFVIYTCMLTDDATGNPSLLDTMREGELRDGALRGVRECVYFSDGIPGPPGQPGPFGEYGPPGPKGMDGLPGRDGYPGENRTATGATGERGAQGKPGPKGRSGPIGRPGPAGPPGRQGPKGPRGPPGEDVVSGWSNGTYDDPGTTGPPGSKGERGDPGSDGRCACLDAASHEPVPNFSAFSVARHSSLQSTDGDEVITWDHVFTNAIGDFNPDTGIFTCCIPGYYFFSFHAQKTLSNENTMVQLMHNGFHVGSALEYGELDDEDSTSNSVVLHLDYDDQIWLQLYDTTGFYGSHHGYTTFHGYLQHAD